MKWCFKECSDWHCINVFYVIMLCFFFKFCPPKTRQRVKNKKCQILLGMLNLEKSWRYALFAKLWEKSVSTIDKSINNKNKNNSNCFDDSNFWCIILATQYSDVSLSRKGRSLLTNLSITHRQQQEAELLLLHIHTYIYVREMWL